MRRKRYRVVREKDLENHYTSEPALYISLTPEQFSEVLPVACSEETLERIYHGKRGES
jgi:hypothetical protein